MTKRLVSITSGLLNRIIQIPSPLVRRMIPVVLPFMQRHPRLLALARRIHFSLWHFRVRVTASRWETAADLDRTFWVSPDKIEYTWDSASMEDRNKYLHRGQIIGGDWDRRRVRFVDFGIGVYQAFQSRFMNGTPWEDTEFYRLALKVISAGSPAWGCHNQAEFGERCRRLDALFEDMKTNGYRSQQDIARSENNPMKGEDEVTVRVGRDGALLFEDGQHRLAMAKLLHIERIPVKITARHSEWCEFKKELVDYARSQEKLGGVLYHPVTHPDLTDVFAHYDDKRFDLIKSHLPFRGGDLLDIGANLGYFCHRFEEEGFNCYAVETYAPTVYFAEKLRIAENRRFKVIGGSIFDYREKSDFDVVLALNVFHHFLKTERNYQNLVSLLNRLRTRVMFFQTDHPASDQMKGAYKNYSFDEFIAFILANSNLTEAKRIGETENGRPIYRLQAT